MNTLYWIAFAIILLPTLLALRWLVFNTWNDFLDAREWTRQLKSGIFVALGLITAMYEKQILDKIFQQFTH